MVIAGLRVRRLLLVVLGFGVLAIGAQVIWWRWAEGQISAELGTQMEAARAAGCAVNTGQTAPGGWPLTATVTVPEVFLSCHQGDAGPALTWSAERVVLRVGLLHPLTLGIDAEGSQHVRLAAWPDVPFRADVLHVTVPLQIGVPARGFVLRAVNLRAGLPAGGAMDPPVTDTPVTDTPVTDTSGADTIALTIGGLDMRVGWTPAAQQNEPAVSVSLQARAVQLPADRTWPLGATVASVSGDLALNGPLPRVRGAASAWAAGWRDGGGNVEVQHLVLNWGALDVSGNATLALDRQMQPMGAGVLHASDPDATLAALHASGIIGDRAQLAAKALLSLVAHAPEDGGKSGVDLPVTLQDRLVSISRFGVARVPPIVWQ